jgi:D-3-phosphoglycerate dehydrogenase
MKIIHLESYAYPAEAKALIERLGEVDYIDSFSQEQFRKMLVSKDYSALFIRLGAALEREDMEICPTLNYVITPTTGLSHIDVDAAREKGVTVVSLKGETDFLRAGLVVWWPNMALPLE